MQPPGRRVCSRCSGRLMPWMASRSRRSHSRAARSSAPAQPRTPPGPPEEAPCSAGAASASRRRCATPTPAAARSCRSDGRSRRDENPDPWRAAVWPARLDWESDVMSVGRQVTPALLKAHPTERQHAESATSVRPKPAREQSRGISPVGLGCRSSRSAIADAAARATSKGTQWMQSTGQVSIASWMRSGAVAVLADRPRAPEVEAPSTNVFAGDVGAVPAADADGFINPNRSFGERPPSCGSYPFG